MTARITDVEDLQRQLTLHIAAFASAGRPASRRRQSAMLDAIRHVTLSTALTDEERTEAVALALASFANTVAGRRCSLFEPLIRSSTAATRLYRFWLTGPRSRDHQRPQKMYRKIPRQSCADWRGKAERAGTIPDRS